MSDPKKSIAECLCAGGPFAEEIMFRADEIAQHGRRPARRRARQGVAGGEVDLRDGDHPGELQSMNDDGNAVFNAPPICVHCRRPFTTDMARQSYRGGRLCSKCNQFNPPAKEAARHIAFLDDIEAVCRKHGLSISHEDGHGAFEIKPFSEGNVAWLRAAWIETE